MSKTQSGEIVYCIKTDNPNRPILITHHENGSLSTDCLFLKCPYFKKCALSRNTHIQAWLNQQNPSDL